MAILVGNAAERAAYKAAGTIKEKGRIVKAVSNIRTAASGLVTPATASRVLGSTKVGKSTAQKAMDMIPDLPGTWDDKAKTWIVKNPTTAGVIAAGVGGTVAGIAGTLAYQAIRKPKKKPKAKPKAKSRRKPTKSRSSSRRRKSSSKPRRRRGYGTEAQYKKRGGLDVKYTKNGQPYVIQKNGRARFIKRS